MGFLYPSHSCTVKMAYMKIIIEQLQQQSRSLHQSGNDL